MTAYSAADLSGIPKTEWIVDGVIPSNSFAMVYGASGVGKTFWTKDLSLSVAAGRSSIWGRRILRSGPTLYLLGEGSGGIDNRVEAWSQAHGVRRPARAIIWDGEFDVTDEDCRNAVLAGYRLHVKAVPELIVVDTLNAYFPDGDENNSTVMKRFVSGCKSLRKTLGGGTVLVVHHTRRKAGTADDERGSGALRAACDAIVRLGRGKGSDEVTVTSDKTKDDIGFDPFSLMMTAVKLDEGSSLALVTADSPAAKLARLAPKHRTALSAVADELGIKPSKGADIGRASGLKGGALTGFTEAAIAAGLMTDNGEKGHPRRLSVTPDAIAALAVPENGPESSGSPEPDRAGSPVLPDAVVSAGDS
ncbi:AAA family ATPase [Alienimonas chondri]|uniref:AAA family ATPase n=1 Tax=Alienimonas chondri TaxID=2681879 RepID=A0ABX1V6Y6_9PLAN|nr:AAA family ATPase [Alienimonas chondri]NNJ24029.1 hypothetical protein [Alienimonas chondri]